MDELMSQKCILPHLRNAIFSLTSTISRPGVVAQCNSVSMDTNYMLDTRINSYRR